jgi:hypothetical protein
LPKRSRCPHCGRLFDRRILDEHILSCKAYSLRSHVTSEPHNRRNLVVDGNNVAFYLASNGTPLADSLTRAMRSLTLAGYRPVIVISAALKHRIDQPASLQDFLMEGPVIEAPRNTDDDLTIIREAQKRNADIVSNDRFLNWLNRYPWISSRLRRFRMTPAGLILS